MPVLSESMVEDAALDWFRALGYHVVGGPDQSPGPHALRTTPEDALDDALRKLTRPERAVPDDRRVGVVWYTQGSGKSLYARGRGTMLPEFSSGELRLQDTDKVSGLIE